MRGSRAGFSYAFKRFLSSEKLAHWLLVLPALLIFVPLQIYPVIAGLGYSFTDWTGPGLGKMEWIGTANYTELVGDRLFWKACRVTAIYMLSLPPLVLFFGMLAALGLHSSRRLAGLARTAVLIPIAMSPVSIGTLFIFLSSPTLGIPALLRGLTQTNVLASPSGALALVTAAQLWSALGTNAFVFLAGLQAIPEEMYEAAVIDGAGPIRRFATITLPLLRETLLMNVVITLIEAFGAFGLIWVMTQGGPYHATTTLGLFVYKEAFPRWRLGYASAVSVVMFVVIAIATFTQMRATRAGTTRYY